MQERKLTDQEEVRLKKFQELKKINKDPFKCEKIKISETLEEIVNKYKDFSAEDLKEKNISVTVSGRVMLLRQTFFVIQEAWNNLQVYLPLKEVSETLVNYFKKFLDIGDIVIVKGVLFRTQKNELTVKIKDFEIISKCLKPLPEKYQGLKDRELKIRNRVIDCLLDSSVSDVFNKRAQIIFEIRKFLNSKSYIEVDTPILQSIYGGANAIPFRTYYNSLKEDYFLRIAPELFLKKMIISGWPKIYEIGRVFRNEGIDNVHNPEFTSLEIYTAYDGLEEIIFLTEEIFKHIAKILKITTLNWHGYQEIKINEKFQCFSMSEILKKKIGVDFYNENISLKEALNLATKYDLQLDNHEKTVGHIFHALFDKLILPDLIQPTFIYGFHKDVSPLAKLDPNNPNFTLRYELFIATEEFANGFAELNDPIDQLERFKKQEEEKKAGNKEAFEIDTDYIKTLEYGLPPTGGIGIGIDRLIMLFTEKNSIKDVIFFPHLKK